MWWRIWIPTWRLYDSVGFGAEAQVFEGGEWRGLFLRPRSCWTDIFGNPQMNLFHSYSNLLDRLIEESKSAENIQDLISYQLLLDFISCHRPSSRKFRLMSHGDLVLEGEIP